MNFTDIVKFVKGKTCVEVAWQEILPRCTAVYIYPITASRCLYFVFMCNRFDTVIHEYVKTTFM